MPFRPPPRIAATTAIVDYFQCPECSCETIEEVARAISYSEIECFYNRSHEYGETHTEYLDCMRMQCRDCGFTVYDGGFPTDLFDYLFRKGWIKGREAPAPIESDWEA